MDGKRGKGRVILTGFLGPVLRSTGVGGGGRAGTGTTGRADGEGAAGP